MKSPSSRQSQHPPMAHHASDPRRLPDLPQVAPAHGPHAPSLERDRKLKRHNEHPD